MASTSEIKLSNSAYIADSRFGILTATARLLAFTNEVFVIHFGSLEAADGARTMTNLWIELV